MQLQKSPASPPPSVAGGSPSSSGGCPQKEVSFDIVVGGWREGCTRAWVERELSQLIATMDLTTSILQIKTFGKRPGFAKLELCLDSQWILKKRRERQLQVLEKLRAGIGSPRMAAFGSPLTSTLNDGAFPKPLRR